MLLNKVPSQSMGAGLLLFMKIPLPKAISIASLWLDTINKLFRCSPPQP